MVFFRTKIKPSLSSCPRLEEKLLIWSSSIRVSQVWLGPGMFVAVDLLEGVKVSGITVGDGCVLRWVVQTVFLQVGGAMVRGNL